MGDVEVDDRSAGGRHRGQYNTQEGAGGGTATRLLSTRSWTPCWSCAGCNARTSNGRSLAWTYSLPLLPSPPPVPTSAIFIWTRVLTIQVVELVTVFPE